MKRRILSLGLLFAMAFNAVAVNDKPVTSQLADKEFVQETYEYCLSLQDSDMIDKQALLTCINSELEYYEYTGFQTVEEAIEFANAEDDEKSNS